MKFVYCKGESKHTQTEGEQNVCRSCVMAALAAPPTSDFLPSVADYKSCHGSVQSLMSVNPNVYKRHMRCGSDLTPKPLSAAAGSNGYQRPGSVWVSAGETGSAVAVAVISLEFSRGLQSGRGFALSLKLYSHAARNFLKQLCVSVLQIGSEAPAARELRVLVSIGRLLHWKVSVHSLSRQKDSVSSLTGCFSFFSGMLRLFTPARPSTATSWVFHRGRCSQTVRKWVTVGPWKPTDTVFVHSILLK